MGHDPFGHQGRAMGKITNHDWCSPCSWGGRSRFGFTLDVVEIGRDEDDEPITSCVVHATKGVAKRTPRLNAQRKRALNVLHNLLASEGQQPPERGTWPNVTLVKIEQFREALKSAGVTDRDNPTSERQQWKRLKDSLVSAGVFHMRDDWCWSSVTERDLS
jgi:hypothetical protein